MVSSRAATKSPDHINPILWKCGGFATGVSSPLLRWQDSRKGLKQALALMLSSHTLCRLVSEAVCPTGGYSKGSLRRACLVGLIPGRFVFLVSIICRSQTEDMSEQAAAECWAGENTAASEQTQLLCACNSSHFTGKVWLRQEISPAEAAAPTCTTDHTGDQSSSGWRTEEGKDGVTAPLLPPGTAGTVTSPLPSHQCVNILMLKVQRGTAAQGCSELLYNKNKDEQEK